MGTKPKSTRGRRIFRGLAITTGVVVVTLIAAGVLIYFGYRWEAQVDLNSGHHRRVHYMYSLEFPGDPQDTVVSKQMKGQRLAESTEWRWISGGDMFSWGHGRLGSLWHRAGTLAEWAQRDYVTDEARTENARRMLISLRDLEAPHSYLEAMERLRIKVESQPYYKQRVDVDDLPLLEATSD